MKYFFKILNLFIIFFFVFGTLSFFYIEAKAAPGDACNNDDPCASGEICVPSGASNGAGTCLNSCSNNSDCEEGFSCSDVGVGRTCIDTSGDDSASDSDTDRDGDGASDPIDGDVSGSRTSCTTDEECSGELCVSGYCVPCTNDTQCGSGKLCSEGRCTDSSDVLINPDGSRTSSNSSGSGIQDYEGWQQRQIDAANSAERGIFTEGLTTECMAFGKCNTCDILKVIGNVFRFAFQIVGIVAVAVIAIGGFTYIRSGGSEETINIAKKTITAAVLGTLIVFAAWVIINTILNITGFNVGGGSWWNPSC